MKYKPSGNRIIVQVIKSAYEKTEGGLIVDQEVTATSKNRLIKAILVCVGRKCVDYKPENEGIEVLIHEVGGVPMAGIDESYRVLREDDIWCFSEEPPEEAITMEDAYDSEIAKAIGKADSQ